MSQEVAAYMEALQEPWQQELATELRQLIHQAIPEVQERLQYKKPHFLKNGKYAAVVSVSKDAVSLTIFNTSDLSLPGTFDGPPERKTLKLRKGAAYDAGALASWLKEASASL
ncbi:DUF1801 domain-containing protein [Paenibacillus methanolicus]|uniref:YdhG-like domain-containing protein n=1 Tax=Paenibacillus methanolicus TaxID=582686 RepID=A0A5S5C194_9BACL|nr:DUF1801 domain-containing protein [Paenibacillus methanolicus]TYP73201.1 hypothetical protein BCM02_107185 [Paenibacillus methanolicus]